MKKLKRKQEVFDVEGWPESKRWPSIEE